MLRNFLKKFEIGWKLISLESWTTSNFPQKKNSSSSIVMHSSSPNFTSRVHPLSPILIAQFDHHPTSTFSKFHHLFNFFEFIHYTTYVGFIFIDFLEGTNSNVIVKFIHYPIFLCSSPEFQLSNTRTIEFLVQHTTWYNWGQSWSNDFCNSPNLCCWNFAL